MERKLDLAFCQAIPVIKLKSNFLTKSSVVNHKLLSTCKSTKHGRSTLRMMTTTPKNTNQSTLADSFEQSLSPRLRNFLQRAQEGNPTLGLYRADASFSRLKARNTTVTPPPEIVKQQTKPLLISGSKADYDVVVAGGTLGIFYAGALQASGWRVAVVERGPLAGRKQEWNISRDELSALVDAKVLTQQQVEMAIMTECKIPGRVGFASSDGSTSELRIGGILNIGIAPDLLVKDAAANFRARGGVVLDENRVTEVRVGPDAVQISLLKQQKQAVTGALGAGGTGIVETNDNGEYYRITGRILIDAMGAFSPISEQARGGRNPDGVCITVGSCMTGPWPENDSPDLIYSFQSINKKRSTQYFWEAFPVHREKNCRTTYMFAYGPCEEGRQSLTEALEDYVETLSKYQNVNIEDCEVRRVLFGFFPSYHQDNPTSVAFDRVLPVGDASGLQSPISFGGFGCCLRHLQRVNNGLSEALTVEDDSLLKKSELQRMQSYSPSLSATGLFHTAMSVQPGQKQVGPFLDANGINEILWSNMEAMSKLGEKVQRPFLQDVITASGLSKTIGKMVIDNPILALKMTAFIGPVEIVQWSGHFFSLLAYASVLPFAKFVQKLFNGNGMLDQKQIYRLNRFVDTIEYGCGADASHD